MKKNKYLFMAIFAMMPLLSVAQMEISLWNGNVPNSKKSKSYSENIQMINNGRCPRICKVTDPTITAFLPNNDNKGRTAIIICPGGGYSRLAIDHEGYDVAQYFRSQGIAAFVLKYRLPSDEIMTNKALGPLADAQRAIRIIRSRAQEFGIDADKIGIMGFSAGGHLAATASTMFETIAYDPGADTTSARPDFSILIYPVITLDAKITHKGTRNNLLGESASDELAKTFSNETLVGANTPPAFMVHAFNDNAVPYENSIRYANAMVANKRQVELHLMQSGWHGFGMSINTPRDWTQLCIKWIDANGFLKR